ncbi:MAG TPA: glycogen/starch/alpha-glucan phosphorylase [Polyangia bacterium]|nr:glycogen/starch/alpha-glucan phosphorylase [Polyangia bacterium]
MVVSPPPDDSSKPPGAAPTGAPPPGSPPDQVDLRRFEVGPFRFRDSDLYDRHLMFDNAVDRSRAHKRQRFEALARTLRDLLMQRWVLSKQTQDRANAKELYYISMEFLIGRSLTNNLINMGVRDFVEQDVRSDGQDWRELAREEPDAGLGNGGLGRLAACFIESLATLEYPAMGYGLRYDYGIFRQAIDHGWQQERPDNWLRHADPWEVARPHQCATVRLETSFVLRHGQIVPVTGQAMQLIGLPFDRPVVGFGAKTINTLRLWGAAAPDSFNFSEFSGGDFFGAVSDRVIAESLTRVLYPDDSKREGRSLRFMQEYFLVCCSLDDIVKRFRRRGNEWTALPAKVAIQLNDTHPALAVAELMRLLLDQAHLSWEVAWDLTVRTLAYTNHTLLPEALEKWPIELFETLLPRHLRIIYEINARFLAEMRGRIGDDGARLERMSLIEEHPVRSVRMAHLAIVGSHSTNGVSEMHSELLRTRLVPDFAEVFPARFNNKTNGVTPRRWLLVANPELARLVSGAIGEGWITDLERLRQLEPLAADPGFRAAFRSAKRQAKLRFASWLAETTGAVVDPDSIFDCQIKRIHEYKRQLLSVLHIVWLYQRLRGSPAPAVPARTFFFAGKAAPAYTLAKLIIKLIHNVAERIDADPEVRQRIKVVFLADYGVSLAERLIPAADVSEQISTAGFEASGTSNMKLMMNGALTIGTRDGATVEMAREAGEDNFFLFGLTADDVASSRPWYQPTWHYWNDMEVRQAIDLLFSNHFSPEEPGIFEPIRRRLLVDGDYYMHLADLRSYATTQERLGQLYADPEAWARKALLNVAASGRFSSDRTIREYARDIWSISPSPVPG